MSFDPTKPTTNSPILSAELRDQFNGLKTLIDEKLPAAEKAAANGVASLDASSRLVQPADWTTLANRPLPVADGTYTVGIGTVQNGTITVVGGIITGIQEASSTPPAPDFVGTGFGDPGYNTDYNENGTMNGYPAYSDAGGSHWLFYSTSYEGYALHTDLSDPAHVDYYKSLMPPLNDPVGTYGQDNGPAPGGTVAAG